MSYYLTIDQGNTSVKIAVFSDFDILDSRRFDSLTIEDIDEFVGNRVIRSSIYSTTRGGGDEIVEALKSRCERVYKMSHELLLTIEIGYEHPELLGQDRIAACAGAAALFPFNEALVVDAGTAITYDYLSPTTLFVGGNIAPGLRMRLKSLHNYTSRLPEIDVEGRETAWGVDTETALRMGAIDGVVAEITHYANKLTSNNKKIILTGGDADFISKRLPIPHEVVPELVSIGLNSILLFNEY